MRIQTATKRVKVSFWFTLKNELPLMFTTFLLPLGNTFLYQKSCRHHAFYTLPKQFLNEKKVPLRRPKQMSDKGRGCNVSQLLICKLRKLKYLIAVRHLTMLKVQTNFFSTKFSSVFCVVLFFDWNIKEIVDIDQRRRQYEAAFIWIR